MYLSLRTNGRETCTRRFVVRLLGPLTFLEHWPYLVFGGLPAITDARLYIVYLLYAGLVFSVISGS